MLGVSLISGGDETAIETTLTDTGLVASDQKNRLTLWIEGEGCTPDAIGSVEAKLLHVLVLRTLESIDSRSTELWPDGT